MPFIGNVATKTKPFASFWVTCAGEYELEWTRITPFAGTTCLVDWGDGTSNVLTEADNGYYAKTYAGAGTYRVKIYNPENVEYFECWEWGTDVFLNSTELCFMENIKGFWVGWTAGGGSFYSKHVRHWRPERFYLYHVPAGYTGTFDSADVVDWRPEWFYLGGMPAGYITTITPNGFSGWTGNTTRVWMRNNNLTTLQVDQILADLWVAFPGKTSERGTTQIDLRDNSVPTGTYQAANPPTTGLEYRYELLNDSQSINYVNRWRYVYVDT